jgi:hypothetical protein
MAKRIWRPLLAIGSLLAFFSALSFLTAFFASLIRSFFSFEDKFLKSSKACLIVGFSDSVATGATGTGILAANVWGAMDEKEIRSSNMRNSTFFIGVGFWSESFIVNAKIKKLGHRGLDKRAYMFNGHRYAKYCCFSI